MKNQKLKVFAAAVPFIIPLLFLVSLSCSCEKDSGGDDSGSPSGGSCQYYEQDPCDFIGSESGCLEEHDFGWETGTECREDVIAPLLNSSDACERAAGECLNTMFKYGPVPIENEPGQEDCRLISPLTCDEAWQEWNNCLTLANSEDC